MENRKLEIARKLAMKEFMSDKADVDSLDERSIDSSLQSMAPSHKASDVICNPNYTNIFSHNIERKYVTQLNLASISAELEKAMRHPSITLQNLVMAMRRMLKASLFGCEVNIGLSPTVGTQVLEFIDNSDNKRRVRRGQSTCFECIDQGDVVLQVSSVQTKKNTDDTTLGSGETVIFVPLIGRTGALGVVEIHGLQSPTVTNTANFQRDTSLLKSLIGAKDYSFVEHTKLWRLPKDRSGGVVSVHDQKDYTYAAHQVVAGIISAVVTEQNGVPFFGGARYNILWEDGLVEKTVVGSELLRTYQNTPQSLGCTSVVSEDLLQDLMWHLTQAAFVLENQRTRETLERTQASVNFPNLRDIDIMDRSLGAVITVVQNLREVFVMGVDCPSVAPDGTQLDVPESSIHILQKKSPQLKIQIKDLKQTPRSVVQLYCAGDKRIKNKSDLLVYENMAMMRDHKENAKAQWVIKELLFPPYFKWNANPDCCRFFMVVIKLKNVENEATRGDLKCVEDLSNILTSSLTVSCKKELRKKNRKVIMQGVERDLNEWRSYPTTTQIAQAVINVAVRVTPGVNIYVALLATGGKRLDYVACSENSNMNGNVLHIGEGISFSVIDHQETLLVEKGFVDKSKLIAIGDYVNVRYGKVEFKAKILKNRGHGFFDVEYSATEKEVGVPIDRISPLVAAFKMKKFGAVNYPLLIMPVRHRTKSIGVLSMDSFEKVERAPYDPQPEPGLKLFLEHLGKVLGSCIDLQRKKRSIREASSVSRNAHSTNDDLFKALFEVVFTNLIYTINTAIVNVKSVDKGGKKRVEVLNYAGSRLSKNTMDTLATYDSTRSSQKPVQFKGNKTVWLLCRVKIPDMNAAKSFKRKKKSFIRKDYIFVINSASDIDDVDSEFLYAVQKFATMILQNMETRKHKADIKNDCLNTIKDTCESWESYAHDRDVFFSEICESIGSLYLSANIYIGKLLQSANSIEYVLASRFSEMQGKVLLRGKASSQSLSFNAVDTFSHVAVTKSDVTLRDSLHHFGAREALEFPFVAVPLATFLDSPLGILAADGLEDITQDEDGSPNEVVSFLYAVASHLSTPMKHFFMEDIAKRLTAIEVQCNSFEDAFKLFKNVILSLLPYSMDVAFVAFNSMKSEDQDPKNLALYKPPTRIGMVYVIQIVEAKCLIDFVSTASIKVQWKNSILLANECHLVNTSEENEPSVCIVRIPQGTRYEDIDLRFYLYGFVDGKKRELSKRSIGLHQMSNDGALLLDYDMECHYSPLPYVHAGRLKFVGRLYSEHDVIRIVFREITCNDLVNISILDQEQCIDPYCVIRWQGIEIGTTEVMRNNSNPIWEDLELYIKPSDDDVKNPELSLSLEVWDTDALGRGSCLGLHLFSIDMLINNNSSKHVALNNEAYPDSHVGSIQFVTDVLYASNMDQEYGLDALKIPFLSATIDSGENLEDSEDFADETHKNRRCELTIQSARISRSVLSVSGDEEGLGTNTQHDLKPFCVVFFNGAEIGRTGSASCTDTALSFPLNAENAAVEKGVEGRLFNSYTWDAELLVLDINAEVNLDICKIYVELWVFDETEKGVKIGFLSVEEKSFSSLLCTSLSVSKWYDVQAFDQVVYSCGEMLLIGRPLDVNLNNGVQFTKPIQNPTLVVDASEIYLKYASVEEECKKHILKIKLNDIVLSTHDLSAVKSGELSHISCFSHFVKPYDKSLFESVMKFEIFETSRTKPMTRAVLSKQDLVDLLDNPLQRVKWLDFAHDKATCEGNATTIARVRILGGPINTEIMIECDGRKFGLDILGAAGLVSPAYHELRRPNSYCKIFWNEELVGQTSIVWNSTDPLWTTHRFFLPIPHIDDLNEDHILSFCTIKLEMWSILSLSPNDRNEELLGCVEVDGDSLKSIYSSDFASLIWYPLEMSSNYPLEKQEYVCSKTGGVKLRIFREGCTLDDAGNDTEQRGGEYLLKIHEAEALTEIDHFTKTNAKVIIYWNNVEVGRTIVISSETSPRWEEEVFLVRAASGESLADQKLQLHVYDTTGGITGEFLGCIDLANDRLVNFFGQKLSDVQAFELRESDEMDDSDNRFVAGTLFVSAEIVTIQPVKVPVQLYSKASLFVRGALNLLSTNVFQNSSDSMCIIYWSSIFDQRSHIEVGRTSVAWKTLNPSWQKENFVIDVPVVDEWSSITVTIEIRDVAAYNDSTFLGSAVLSGNDLKHLLNRSEDVCSVLLQYKLNLSAPLILPEFSSYTVDYKDGDGAPHESFLVLAGGAGGDLIMAEEKAGHNEDLDENEEDNKIGSKKGGGLFKDLKRNLSVLSMKDRLKKRELKEIEFRIHEIDGLCLPDEILRNGLTDISKNLYFLVSFNDQENRIGSVKGVESMSKSFRVKFNSAPLMTSFSRPVVEDLTQCITRFELWISVDAETSTPNTETEVSQQCDLFLGTLLLQGKEIVSLMRPKAPSQSFSLKNKKDVETSKNRFEVGSHIVVSGLMPNLLRQLSSNSMGDTFRRGGSSLRLDTSTETDELMREEKFEIHICEASGLFKSTSMLGSLQEYRADIYWNEELQCSSHYIKATPSAVSSSVVDVIWPNEYLSVVKAQGEVLLDCKLTVEITTNSSFWGAVNIEGEALLDFFENSEPDLHELTTLPHKSTNEQKNIKGKLFFGGREISGNNMGVDEASSDLREFDTAKPLPEGMKDLNLYVLAANDLGKADKFGKSDPFCVVKWNGVEIGKTDVKNKTLNPVWEEGHFLLRTYVNLGPKDEVVHKNLIKSYIAHERLKLGSDSPATVSPASGRRRQVVQITAITKETIQARTDCVLVIEVWDWNAMGNSVFLGSCELKGSSLASFFECKYTKRNWYKLEKSKNLSRSENKLVRGSIEISVGPVAGVEETSEPYSLEVEVAAAKNLCKVDQYSQADPYCIVRWNQDVCGKTLVLKNTLNPEWENEVFDIHFQSRKDVDAGYLYIEVWDFDVGVQDKFLGSSIIKGNKLRHLIDKGDSKWFDLSKSDFLTPALQSLLVSGSIKIKIAPADPNKRKRGNVKTTSFEFTVLGAEKLSNSAFFGNVDSFCILKVNGREIGMSSTMTDTASPAWNEKFPLILETYMNQLDEECSDDNVSVEVWSVLALARGDFLGVVYLTFADLLELSKNCKSLKTTDRMKATFPLQKMIALPESVQTHIVGSLRLHARHLGDVDLKELGATAAAEVQVQWPVHVPLVPGTNHGFPSFEISILSIKDLIVPTKGRSKIIPDAFCLVFFNGQEVGTTPVLSGENPVWKNPEPISIKIPENVESQSYWVTIKVYNMQSLDRGEFLGQVSFSFWSLFCLHFGIFTLQLLPEISNKDQFIKGKITLSIDIYSPLWDSVIERTTPGIERTITILNSKGLPKVNHLVPNTKCVVFYDGGIKVRSPLVMSSVQPVWSPLPTLDILLDYRFPKDIIVQVIYVDVIEKREFCLGEVAIPFEFIVRPPLEPFELWLTEPFKSAPKGYNFLLDGSVSVMITANKDISAWKPWSSRLNKPLVYYPVEELKMPAAIEKSKVEPMSLSTEELQWIGSAGSFTNPHVLSTKPDILLIPVKGMGAVVDGRCIGNDPQKQYAMAVKRDNAKLALSDPMMIRDSFTVIQKCVINLRRKELYSHIREISLNKLRLFFENMIRKNRFDMSAIFKRISNVISSCFPGTVSFIALSSKDSKSMRYTLFEKSFENEEAPSFFTLWEGEGIEWGCVGRHSGKGSCASPEDLIHADSRYRPTSFSRFRQFRPPRLCSPLVCGDVSLGVVGIENFDIYRAGQTEKFADLLSVQQWLDNVGTLCGNILYTGREKNVMKLLESYALLSVGSVSGLLKVLLENCLQVLQGCRLMEIWSLQDRSLTSLATSWPESISAPTKWIALQGIRVNYVKATGGGALANEIKNVGKKIGKFLFGSKEKTTVHEDIDATQSDEVVKPPSALSSPCGYVLGIYYGGREQFQYAEHFKTSKDQIENFEHTFGDVKIHISNDRDIWLSIYCIDKSMTILEEWSGKFQMVNFKEKNIISSLSNDNKDMGHFCFTSSLQWPSPASATMQRAIEMKALEEVKCFSVTVHQAHGLQKTDLVGSSDPFCEIHWQDELIGKTHVMKNNLEPVWEETFELEPSHNQGRSVISCRVEVWDMDFLGKGNFMGEFSIPLDQLLQPPTSDIEVTLGPKGSFNKTENKYVGGTLVLSHTVENNQNEDDAMADDDASKDSDSDSEDSENEATKLPSVYEIPKLEKHLARKLVEIEDPVLKLNVGKATGLAKADLLGLANAYIKVYRLSTAEFKAAKPNSLTKDPSAITRVIEKSLNPVWNDGLLLGLNIPSSTDQGSKSSAGADPSKENNNQEAGLLDEWPVFVLEVWSKVKVGDGAFLGMLSLNPLQYALKKSFSGDLSPSPFLDTKGNKHVKGSISLDFKIEGQTSESHSANFSFFQSKYLLHSTCATVTIISASVDGVIKTGLRKKTVNPYCVVRWGQEKIGETAIKKNSVEPSWANEKITVDLSKALIRSEWDDITIEIWNKQTEESFFFGEVVVSMIELLHPNAGEVIHRNLRKLVSGNGSGKEKEQAVKGFLNFRVSKHRFPQKIVPKLKYVHCFPLQLNSFDKNKADPILKHYGQENPRVILTNPVKLEVIRNTEEEIRRQKNENIDLPGVINHIEDLNNKYKTSIFDQVGLISEIHYGQTLSAFQRQASTVLHVGECDCFLLPTIVKRSEKNLQKESGDIDSNEETSPVVIKMETKKKMKKKFDIGEGDLCLVSRYMKESIPQRDVQFLKSMRDIISKSIVLFEQRQKRRSGRQTIVQKLKAVCSDIHRYSPEDVAMSTISDVHIQFECKVDIYLLRRTQSRLYLVRCSPETGVVEELEAGGWDTSELIDKAAKLSRHGLLLQFYRGRHAIASTDWRQGFSEASLLSLQSIREDVRSVESKNLIQQIVNLSRQSAPMGACVSPIMVKDEYMVGVMMISGTDKIPHSIYRMLRSEQQSSSKEVSSEEDIETLQMFEEGTTECMRDVGLHLGKALFSSALVHAMRDIKTFPVREDTDPEDVIRFCFRKLIEVIPILSEISIWRVLISPEGEDVVSAVSASDRDSLIAAGFFGTEKVSSILSTPDERVIYQARCSSTNDQNDSETSGSMSSVEKNHDLISAKKIYSNLASWNVDLPAMLNAHVSVDTSKLSTHNNDETSGDVDSDSESSNSDSDEQSSEVNTASPLKQSKSLFGGMFTSSKKQTPSKTLAEAPPKNDSFPNKDAVCVPDNIVRAHSEINRCISTLTKSSFHINTSGGAYLSLIQNKFDNVFEQFMKQKFQNSSSFINQQNASGASSHSAYSQKKTIIPATRGVNTNERLIHISESESSPPNLQKAPLPKGKSSTKTTANVLDKMRDKKLDSNTPTPHDNGLRYEYFIAVRACGLGEDDGWGIIGEEVSSAVDNIAESMLDVLVKVFSSSSTKKKETKKHIPLQNSKNKKK